MGSAVLNVFLTELQAYADKTHINVYGYINYSVNILFCTCLIIAFYMSTDNKIIFGIIAATVFFICCLSFVIILVVYINKERKD